MSAGNRNTLCIHNPHRIRRSDEDTGNKDFDSQKEKRFNGGQAKQIDDATFNAAYEKYKNREINKAQFADSLKISRPTLDKLLKDKGLM